MVFVLDETAAALGASDRSMIRPLVDHKEEIDLKGAEVVAAGIVMSGIEVHVVDADAVAHFVHNAPLAVVAFAVPALNAALDVVPVPFVRLQLAALILAAVPCLSAAHAVFDHCI